jgi:hypothetical protein
MIGVSRSGWRAPFWNSIGPPITTNLAAASRPALKSASKKSARPAFGMATGASCSFAPRGLGDQHEEDASDLHEFGPPAAQQDAKEKSEGEAGGVTHAARRYRAAADRFGDDAAQLGANGTAESLA